MMKIRAYLITLGIAILQKVRDGKVHYMVRWMLKHPFKAFC
jgi:hypothetical protein